MPTAAQVFRTRSIIDEKPQKSVFYLNFRNLRGVFRVIRDLAKRKILFSCFAICKKEFDPRLRSGTTIAKQYRRGNK